MVSYDELIDPQPELNCTDIEEEDDDSENEYFDPGSKMQRRTEQPSQGQASATDCGAHEGSVSYILVSIVQSVLFVVK